MKRILVVLMLACAIIVGGAMVDAKTTPKKKSGSKPKTSVRVEFDSAGDPILEGHTYRVNMGKERYDFQFGYGSCDILIKSGNYMTSYGYPWDYDGTNVYIYDPGVSVPMFQGVVSNDGQSIKLNSGYTLKIVK